MATVALVLAGLLIVATVILFVVVLRRRPTAAPIAGRTSALDGTSRPGHELDARHRSSVDQLGIGAEVAYDDREWIVIGWQRFDAPDDVAASTAWHLDLKGQPGWMATSDDDPGHLIFAVGAEKPEAIDPTHDPLIWRDVPWIRIAESAEGPLPVEAEGQRRRNGQPREDLTAEAVERIMFTRDDLPRRRLILERCVGDDRWAAWIGDRISASLIDVTRWPTT